MARKKALIGELGVDSGQLVVCDPCYIDGEWKNEKDFNPENPKHNFSYNACCQATIAKERAGQLYYKLGRAGIGVAFSTGYGDGTYPVYATYNKEGRISKIEIRFI